MELSNYVSPASKRKWFNVVVFRADPHESPRTSKDCHELARFYCLGDAYNYVQQIIERSANPDSTFHGWARIVIR